MKALTIRHVPRRLAEALERERRRTGASLNATVLNLLSRSLGLGDASPRRNGLARLSGTWSDDDHRQFEGAVAPFETVDDEMWA